MKTAHGLKFWCEQAKDIDVTTFHLDAPVHVIVGEAHDVAAFATHYWRGTTGVGARVGLESAARRTGNTDPNALSAHSAADILSLSDAVAEAQTAYQLTAKPRVETPLARAHDVYDEITAVLEYVFADGTHVDDHAALDTLMANHHDDIGSVDGLASALTDFAKMADAHRRDLDGVGGFSAATIDEAVALAKALREAPPSTQQFTRTDEGRAALSVRNQLITLLARKVDAVRSAARFVFRAHPEIARQANSAYQQRKRAVARRHAKGATSAPTTPASTT